MDRSPWGSLPLCDIKFFVTSVTTSLKLISDLWCAAVLRENRLQLFTATPQNTHLTVFERCGVPAGVSHASCSINFWAGSVIYAVPLQAWMLQDQGEKGLGVMQWNAVPLVTHLVLQNNVFHPLAGWQGGRFFLEAVEQRGTQVINATARKCKGPASFSISVKWTQEVPFASRFPLSQWRRKEAINWHVLPVIAALGSTLSSTLIDVLIDL